MNSLPSNIGRHTLFRENSNSHTFVFQDGFTLPTPDKIKMQVRYHGRILKIDPEIAVSGQRVTYTYTPEMLADIPEISDHYLVLDGESFLGGQLGVLIGYGEQDISETQVTVTDGEVTTVEVFGLDLVAAQVDIATQKADESAASASVSSEWAQAAGDFSSTAGSYASTASAKATEASGSATAAINAKNAAEDARDIAVANSVERLDVATYAAAVPYFSGSQPREIYVAADEAYYDGESSWYKYVPGIGEALLGIDFNYKE